MTKVSIVGSLIVGMSFAAGCSSADPATTESASSSTSSSLEGVEPGMRVHWQKGFESTPQPGAPQNEAHGGGGGGGGNLIDHGGKVLPASHTYAIWWGNQASFPSDAKSGIDALFEGFGGTSFLGLGQQYMRGAGVSSSFVTNLTDTSSPPSRGPSTSAIVNEACKVITAAGAQPDASAIYFVFTSNYPGGRVNYCAWHSYGACNGTTIQVAYMPNTTGVAGCDPGNAYGCNGYSQGTRSIANVTSHEFMEAITDANASAWYDGSGSEIGDKCAWQFGSCVNLSTGNWQLQKEWSNSASGCVQQ